MFENNPLLEPRQSFELPGPHQVKVVGVYLPGDPGYAEHSGQVRQLETPLGYIYCLNVKRRAEFMLRRWLEQVPDSQDALKLLDRIMLIQDYLFDTVSMEPGYADQRENGRAREILDEAQSLADALWENKKAS